MAVDPRRVWWLVKPTWPVVLLAAVATMVVTQQEWRTWQTGGRAVVEYHYFWPAYTWSHTDYVQGPSSLALTWNFALGMALWYLPAVAVDRTVRAAIGAVGVTDLAPPSLTRLVDVLSLRLSLALLTLAFALVGSFSPIALSVYSLPGFLLVKFALPVWGIDIYTEYTMAYYSPVAFPAWYGLFALFGGVATRIGNWRERRTENAT
ncbi:hypothetical protein [Haloarchaeobius sp. DYHT-AS-18]|uniref:hypothetical protein n=1 Tax=Haloarchaeobius sp. DYHT-AS-18 TaxID=3446117 RepID=UPI003EBF03BF